MGNHGGKTIEYSAKHSYRSGSTREEYESQRFSGILGRHRYAREQKAVASLVGRLPEGITVADCPCGNGRWWPILAERASRIIAVDISSGMLERAKEEVSNYNITIEIIKADAERLVLQDKSVDYTFSHALTKHLPIPVQYHVLAEFSRVSRYGVICSFGIFSHITYEFWRCRKLEESYPTFLEELKWMAKAAKLEIRKMHKCTTLLGVEYAVLFDKK